MIPRLLGPESRHRIKDPRDKQTKEERMREEERKKEERGITSYILNTLWAEGLANFKLLPNTEVTLTTRVAPSY